MRRALVLLVGVLMSTWAPVARAQNQPQTSTINAVTYVDVAPASERAAIGLLKTYRDASRKEPASVRIDLLQQIGRPGHLAIVEAWKDQRALDQHAEASHTKAFLDKLRPIQIDAYNQQIYQTLGGGPTTRAFPADAIYVVAHIDTIPVPENVPGPILTTLVDRSRKDEGNLRFDLLQHTTRMNHFTIVEVWGSQKALDAHVAASHTKQARQDLHPMVGAPYDDRLYQAIQ